MKRISNFCAGLLVALTVSGTATAADVPMLLNYQGRLTDPAGAPKDGTFSMTFAVYDAESGGNALPSGTPWGETQSVTVVAGVFNVLLGSVTALPTTLFQGGPSDALGARRYLQVMVAGEVLLPSRRIASAAYSLNSPWGWASAGTGLAGARNVRVTCPSADTVTVAAEEIVVEDAYQNRQGIRSLSATAHVATPGANGLDTGTEASAKWYFIWVIRKSSDGTTASLLSGSPTSPALPSGYDQKALVSAVRNDSSGDFVPFVQQGRRYSYTAWQRAATGGVGEISWSLIDISPYVPDELSDFCYGTLGTDNSVAFITNDVSAVIPSGAPASPGRNVIGADYDLSAAMVTWQFDMRIPSTLWWVSRYSGDEVWVHGFEINKL